MAQKRQDKFAPFYVVCGQETFLKQQAIDDILARALSDADRAMALSDYDGASAGLTLADVLDDVRTLPFLTECRVVVVRQADVFISRYRDGLETYAENPSPTGVLLIECKSLPGNTRLYKRVKAVGDVIKCEPVKRGQLPSWVANRCRETYGLQIDARASALLCDLIGDNLGLLDGELQKLSLFIAGRKRITPADVEAVVGQQREESVWDILSSMAAGDTRRALALWEEVWQTDRAASARAIGGIAFTVRRLLSAKRAQQAGASLNELAKILMRWGDTERVKAELAAFTVGQLEGMLTRLLEADVAAKTGGPSVRSSIEAFIVEISQQGRNRRATG